jgi:hypothetical protein
MSARSGNRCTLILLGTNGYEGLSPLEMQQVADPWKAWFSRLTEHGKAVDG